MYMDFSCLPLGGLFILTSSFSFHVFPMTTQALTLLRGLLMKNCINVGAG